jgi:membrane-associated phospholipid phosphatase
MINAFDRFFLTENPIISERLLKSLSLLADPKANLLFWGLISLFFLWKKGRNALNSNPLHLFVLTNFIMLVCGIVKIGAGRARPYLLNDNISGFHFFSVDSAYLSFPSSHCAIAICFSIFLKRKYPLNNAIYLLPLFIGASRILLNVHFASDVIFGVFIGAVIETFVNKAYKPSVKKFRSYLK